MVWSISIPAAEVRSLKYSEGIKNKHLHTEHTTSVDSELLCVDDTDSLLLFP